MWLLEYLQLCLVIICWTWLFCTQIYSQHENYLKTGGTRGRNTAIIRETRTAECSRASFQICLPCQEKALLQWQPRGVCYNRKIIWDAKLKSQSQVKNRGSRGVHIHRTALFSPRRSWQCLVPAEVMLWGVQCQWQGSGAPSQHRVLPWLYSEQWLPSHHSASVPQIPPAWLLLPSSQTISHLTLCSGISQEGRLHPQQGQKAGQVSPSTKPTAPSSPNSKHSSASTCWPHQGKIWGVFVMPQDSVGFCSRAGCQQDS